MNTPNPWSEILTRLRAATAGEFEVRHELGRGGMAIVFLAHELALMRPVAMKVMSPESLAGLNKVERFLQEARTVAKLKHPNIVTIHTVRQIDDLYFFTMEFVDGGSLDHILRGGQSLSITTIRALLATVGSALDYAHRRGVVHRDIKPANILIGDDGIPVVTDFGIAKDLEDHTAQKTATQLIVGTLAYMSPERIRLQPTTPASDQYSLGVVAYELITGRVPFSGSVYETMQGHIEQPVPDIRQFRPDCPADLETTVLRMVEKDPAARWPSMQQAVAALAAPFLEGSDAQRELADSVELVKVARDPVAAADAPSEIPPTHPTPLPDVPRTAPTPSISPSSLPPVTRKLANPRLILSAGVAIAAIVIATFYFTNHTTNTSDLVSATDSVVSGDATAPVESAETFRAPTVRRPETVRTPPPRSAEPVLSSKTSSTAAPRADSPHAQTRNERRVPDSAQRAAAEREMGVQVAALRSLLARQATAQSAVTIIARDSIRFSRDSATQDITARRTSQASYGGYGGGYGAATDTTFHIRIVLVRRNNAWVFTGFGPTPE